MNARLDTPVFSDCAIADLSLADWGRKEIRIAETEMPGLMAVSYTHLTLPTNREV